MAARNLVVLCLDSVRKDFFEEHAHRIRSRSDLSFRRCRAASSWTAPSHASMVSGRLPSEHGVHTHSRRFDSLPTSETLFGDLEDHVALGASANAYAGAAYGFDRYFDEFYDFSPFRRFPDGMDPSAVTDRTDATGPGLYVRVLLDALRHDRPLRSLANGAIPVLDDLVESSAYVPGLVDDGAAAVLRASERQIRAAEEPFVAFCTLMETHIPHSPTLAYDADRYPDVPDGWSSDERDVWELCLEDGHDEYWRRREQVYAAAVDYLDRTVVEYVERTARATDRETTVIVTGDHGENHGTEADEGLANHKSSLSEALLHVPLEVIDPPDRVLSAARGRTDRPTSQLQLRTLLAAIARERPPGIDGWPTALPAEIAGMSPGPDPPSNREYWDRAIRCCVRDGTKLVWDSAGNAARYEVDAPSSQTAVGDVRSPPEWATEPFPDGIDGFKREARRHDGGVDVDESTKRRLERLGYR